MQQDTSGNSAFTLAELAILVTIVGLMIGGVFVGRGVLNNAELRSVLTDVESYRVVIAEFEDQYDGMPGDIYNATDLWTDANLANGNHNGRFDSWDGEGLQAWLQLRLAEKISGPFTGIVSNGDAVLGVNVPASKFGRGGFSLRYIASGDGVWDHGNTPGDGTVTIPDNSLGNVLVFGAYTNNSYTLTSVLDQQTALMLDKKSDDGWPDSGTVQSRVGTSCVDTAGARPIYDVAGNSADTCTLVFHIKKD